MKTKVKMMGQFADFDPPVPRIKPQSCWHCKRPVRETVGKSGLCKRCIEEAKLENRQNSQSPRE